MNDYVFFVSYLDVNPENNYAMALCIDIRGASTESGALLQTFPRKPNCDDNQQWKLDSSGQLTPEGGPWNFIRSKFKDGLVIGINGKSLEMSKQKANDDPELDNQLWALFPVSVKDPADNAWYYIQSKNGNVISIKGSSPKAGTLLELDAPIVGDNQLWHPQAFS